MTAQTFIVRLPQFAGTLEGLISAIHRGEILLAELPLSLLAAQLLAYLQQRSDRALPEQSMEWAELASRLIRWKSFSLLPAEEPGSSEAQQELSAEMEQQFRVFEQATLERIRDFLASRLLAAGGALESASARGEFLPELPEDAPLFPSLWTLRQKFQTLRKRARQNRQAEILTQEMTRDETTVEQMTQWVQERLKHFPPGQWMETGALFVEAGSLRRQSALFLAMLELTRTSLFVLQTSEYSFSFSTRDEGSSGPCVILDRTHADQ